MASCQSHTKENLRCPALVHLLQPSANEAVEDDARAGSHDVEYLTCNNMQQS